MPNCHVWVAKWYFLKGDSAEIGFCKALKYKGIDGALLLQGIKQRDGEIAKEVAGVLIFAVDFVFCGMTNREIS